MKYVPWILLYILTWGLVGCSTVRTKHSDKTMTIGIRSDVLDPINTMKLTSTFIKSGRFKVIDRFIGFDGIVKEQDLEHGNMSDRFDDKKKYAWIGKLHGIGGLIIPMAVCEHVPVEDKYEYRKCTIVLSLVDTNTGETVVSVNGKGKWKPGSSFNFEKLVTELEEQYPTHFVSDQTTSELRDYEKESAMRAE